MFYIPRTSDGQSLIGAAAFEVRGGHYPSGTCVTDKSEFIYCALDYISDSVLLSVRKYNPDLTIRNWMVTMPFDSTANWYAARVVTDHKGDVYLLYSKGLKTGIESNTYVYKMNRETGDTTRIKVLEGSLAEAELVSTKDLYLLQWLTSDQEFNQRLLKIDLDNFQVAWQKKLNFSIPGRTIIMEAEGGVSLFNYFHFAPRVDGGLLEGSNIAGPLSIHFSSDGNARAKSIKPFCCVYGFIDLIVNSYGDYYALASFPGTTIFGTDTIKEWFNYLASGMVGIEGSSGLIKKAKGTTQYEYYDFRNPIPDRRGILGCYSSAMRGVLAGPTRLALLDQWDLKEIWSKRMPGFIMDMVPDGQGNLFVLGDFDRSINFEGQIFETQRSGFYISKYDINKLGLPEGPENTGTANIFPNPFDEELTIYYDRKVKPLTIKVFTNLGQLHSEYTGLKNRLKINTEYWDNGTYYLQIHEEGQAIATKKILKVSKD